MSLALVLSEYGLISYNHGHFLLSDPRQIPRRLLVNLFDSKDIFTKVAGGVIATLVIGATRSVYRFVLSIRLSNRVKEDDCTPDTIKSKVLSNRDPYIRPDCQDDIPSNTSPANRRPIFGELDRLLGPPRFARFILILADTGMGKSECLQRYYAYHWRSMKRRKRFRLIVHVLNGLDVDDLVKRVKAQMQGSTVLLLDALDEDDAAKADFEKRFSDLVRLAGKFHAIVITCRTQFLAEGLHVPGEIELPPSPGPTSLSTVSDGDIQSLYISLLSDTQVGKYLSARLPYWLHPFRRVKAQHSVRRFKDLVSRPLLLTFIEELISKRSKVEDSPQSYKEPEYSFQAYKIIVKRWLERERGKMRPKLPLECLWGFCEEFAVHLFTTGRECASTAELSSLIEQFGVIALLRHAKEQSFLHSTLRGRSLLHNDASDNWRFAHRSFMEFLLVTVAAAKDGAVPWAGAAWTDQMCKFAGEMVRSGECKRLLGADLHNIDLKGVKLTKCDLRGANLIGANLSNCHLFDVNLSGANLSGAQLEGALLKQTDLRGASLERTILNGAQIEEGCGLTLLQAGAAISNETTKWPHQNVRFIENDKSIRITTIAFGADCGRAIYRTATSLANDPAVVVWTLNRTFVTIRRPLAPKVGAFSAVALSADGERAVCVSYWQHRSWGVWATYTVWNLGDSVAETDDLGSAYEGYVTAVAVSPNGEHAISASTDMTLRIWDLAIKDKPRRIAVKTGRVDVKDNDWPSFKIDAHMSPVTAESARWPLFGPPKGCINAVAVSSDGKRAISGANDATIIVWDLEWVLDRENKSLELTGHKGPVTAVALSSDGKRVLSGSIEGAVYAWNLFEGGPPRELEGHKSRVNSVAFSADGRRAVSGSDDRTVRVWDLESGDSSQVLAGHTDSVLAASFSDDGERVFSGSADGIVRIWFPPDERAFTL